MSDFRLGLIGVGNMGGAILGGILDSGVLPRESVRIFDSRSEHCEALVHRHGVMRMPDNATLAVWANVLLLCTKPQQLSEVLQEIAAEVSGNTLVISIAAGVSTESLERLLGGSARVVRAMPNFPVIVKHGVTALAKGSTATEQELAVARTLFSTVGKVVEVPESQMDAVTGLSGSGPAFLLLAIEALADGGVRMGLSRSTALTLASETALGAAAWLIAEGEHPAVLRDRVTSPGGTTIAGLEALEQGAARHAFMNAVCSAARRSEELGKPRAT